MASALIIATFDEWKRMGLLELTRARTRYFNPKYSILPNDWVLCILETWCYLMDGAFHPSRMLSPRQYSRRGREIDTCIENAAMVDDEQALLKKIWCTHVAGFMPCLELERQFSYGGVEEPWCEMRKLWYESMFHAHKTTAATIIQRCYRVHVWRRNVLYNPNTLTGALYLKIVCAVYAHLDGLITPSGRSQ